jgi:multisubunit Na+/H+ antiporter MnhB subunit
MKKFDIFVGIVLAIIFVAIYIYLQDIDLIFHEEVLDFESIAKTMNIRNMVTTIYLGPRILDTVLEVMVVFLTVIGMKFIRSE